MLRLVVVSMVCSTVAATCANTSSATPILGAGSTLLAPLQQDLSFAFESPHKALYSAIGSGTGRQQLIQGTVDFAATETVFSASERQQLPDVQLLPTFGSAVCVVYNLPGDTRQVPLNLTRQALTAIFAGEITSWADARIVEPNPMLRETLLAAPVITRVVRLGTSGTTDIFTSALVKFNFTWFNKSFADDKGWPSPALAPAVVTASENAGVAVAVVWKPGAIGYVGHATAAQFMLPTASLLSGSYSTNGEFVAPSVSALRLTGDRVASQFSGDFTGALVDTQQPGLYPIGGWTYYAVKRTMDCCGKAYWLRKYLLWCIEDAAVRDIAEVRKFITLPADAVARYKSVLDGLMCVDTDGKTKQVSTLGSVYEPTTASTNKILNFVQSTKGFVTAIVVLSVVLLLLLIGIVCCVRVLRQRSQQRSVRRNHDPDEAPTGVDIPPVTLGSKPDGLLPR
eukprot:TRINITY_DN9009_c0_g1_i1.p1 TRINITY_DN9009_c0_g1~~TRINITY_DN9009_c0_g1_i1.p1  ORF type:complete len:461 (+),score=66.70 TRINITY_DN9009_c0_g1_i1:22-1383(+)